jgi:superfamily I DNA/RNA helicase
MKHIPTLPWKRTMVAHLPKYKKPNVHFFYRVIDETNYIIRTILQIQKEEPNASVAIMSRMNVDLYRFEEECILKNIPYRIFEMEGAESVNHNSIDLVINVESFQEMTQDWVDAYLDIINMKTRSNSVFYHSNSFGYKNRFQLNLGAHWKLLTYINHPRHWTDSHRTEVYIRE